jgi:thioredoxin 1
MGNIVEVSDDAFESEIMGSDLPVMLDFGAEWCGPCKMVDPVVEELAAEYDGKIKFARMDVDNNRQTPIKLGIRNIPTFIFVKNGEVVNTIIGAYPKSSIEEELKKLL